MTTAPAAPQEHILYGPDGQALASSTPTRAAIEETAATAGDWRAVRTTDNATVWEKTTAADAEPKQEQPATPDPHALAASDERIAELEAQLAATRRTAAPAPKTADTPDQKSRKGFDHWGPWLALWAAVGLTASGEYALAHFVGFRWFSALLPVGIDVYVIQAFRRHRDVAVALILMVVTNALVHLAEAGLFGVVQRSTAHGETAYAPTWWLIVLVSAIAPFIVWRVHRITEKRPATGTVAAPATAAETASSTVAVTPTGTVSSATSTTPATAQAAPETTRSAERETRPEQRETAPATRRATPRRNTTARTRKPAETGVAAPSKLRSKDEQLAIVGPFVDAWNGPEKDLPLQPIAEALGASKATASRRVAEYRSLKTA